MIFLWSITQLLFCIHSDLTWQIRVYFKMSTCMGVFLHLSMVDFQMNCVIVRWHNLNDATFLKFNAVGVIPGPGYCVFQKNEYFFLIWFSFYTYPICQPSWMRRSALLGLHSFLFEQKQCLRELSWNLSYGCELANLSLSFYWLFLCVYVCACVTCVHVYVRVCLCLGGEAAIKGVHI